MIRVLLCITGEHDSRLLLLAIVVCVVGSFAVVQLFGHIRSASGQSRTGWVALTAVALGSMVWSTHFVAMMAYRAPVPVVLDPSITLISLIIAIVASAPGLLLAVGWNRRLSWLGGALVGLAIAAMHYTGMAAYRIDGIVEWRLPYVAASVLLSVLLGAVALDTFAAHRGGRGRIATVLLLATCVVVLHFTGMAAMTIVPLRLQEGGLSGVTMELMAIATAFAGLLVIGCAGVSALIDTHTKGETYRRLQRMALHDPITDLPNRAHFNEELRRRVDECPGGEGVAVVMLDLSRFKAINDAYGHQAGDQLLVALAARFDAIRRSVETICRLGGDEFAAIVPFRHRDEVDAFLRRIDGVFEQPFTFERFRTSCGASIGVALSPLHGDDPDALLASADLAMYRAKAAKSALPCFYEPEMYEAARDRRDLASELRAAIGTDQFEIHYQVQASVATGAVSGYEALLRWRHPVRGLISPVFFIPLAEETGEIVRLGNWVIRQACREAAAWPEPHIVAVNLSPLQLADPLLVATVEQALAESGLEPSRLELELTESAIIRDRERALDQIRPLKTMGVALALDDFGIGYSSLDVLRTFPFDRIKLDASFVSRIEDSAQAVAILSSVASLGRRLGMSVLAEGIETPAQLLVVAREGCGHAQGFLLGRPARALVDPVALAQTMTIVTHSGDPLVLVA